MGEEGVEQFDLGKNQRDWAQRSRGSIVLGLDFVHTSICCFALLLRARLVCG